MNSEIEDKASGWLACFWNETGNYDVFPVVFADKWQVVDWACAALRAIEATDIRARGNTVKSRTPDGMFGESEFGYTLHGKWSEF